MASLSDSVVMTAEGKKALQAELEQLETVARREIAERIKTAREWGDLKENSEYHDAKNDQAHLETKILRIREQLLAAEVREVETQTDVVGFGSCVEVEDAQVRQAARPTRSSPPHEADPREGRLSIDSPVGKALVGAQGGGHREARDAARRPRAEDPQDRLRRKAPQAVGEHVGRLQRREVPAVVGRLPALDVEDALDERPRHVDELLREVEEGQRRGDPLARRRRRRRAPSRRAGARPVGPERRADAARRPSRSSPSSARRRAGRRARRSSGRTSRRSSSSARPASRAARRRASAAACPGCARSRPPPAASARAPRARRTRTPARSRAGAAASCTGAAPARRPGRRARAGRRCSRPSRRRRRGSARARASPSARGARRRTRRSTSARRPA